MMRMLAIVLGIAIVGAGIWLFTRDGGVLERVTQERVEGALLANGMPLGMAECMAPKLTEKLSIAQLMKLEELGPQGGEASIPRSPGQVMDRLRRVDDSEAVSALVTVSAGCATAEFGNLLKSM